MALITGAKRLVNQLVKKGVKDIFGYPGGAILPVLNELHQHEKIKYYLSRTEQGGGFMAEGYAKITGNPGIVMTTSGPGALNVITCLQNALSDGTPLLALSGQVSTSVLGSDAFQEADVVGISKPCTKWNHMINKADNIDSSLNKAFQVLVNGRPGPVLLDLPKDIMSGPTTDNTNDSLQIIENNDHLEPTIGCDDIIKMILSSKRPVILAGQGVIQAGPEAIKNLRMIANLYHIPVTTTLMGLGIFDEKHSLSLKMVGMHGSFYANMAVQNCDLLLNFGSRFDDRITGLVSKFAPNAKIIHVDILAKNINKVIKTPFYINASCGPILKDLILQGISNYTSNKKYIDYNRTDTWLKMIKEWRNTDFNWPKFKNVLQGREVIAGLNKIIYSHGFLGHKFTIVADVGAHQMWAAQFIDYNYPRVRFLTSGGLGSMGFALPASIGAKIGSGTDTIICICGDGGFTMSMTEILTAVENKVNIKVLIINNSYQLMVKMWQDKFYDKRYVGVKMNNPPFELVCEAMGCKGMKIQMGDNIEEKLTELLTYDAGPIVANVITDSSEAVLPMVSPGKALDDMIVIEDSDEKLEGDAPC
jgi:acetolactate synthase-1/2/3 large subunit